MKQEKDRKVELAKIAAQEAEIAAERDVKMARIDSIVQQADKDRDLKRAELESDKESKLASKIEL